MTVSVLWLFLTASCVGLQCVSMIFPDCNHLFRKGYSTMDHVCNLECLVDLCLHRHKQLFVHLLTIKSAQ